MCVCFSLQRSRLFVGAHGLCILWDSPLFARKPLCSKLEPVVHCHHLDHVLCVPRLQHLLPLVLPQPRQKTKDPFQVPSHHVVLRHARHHHLAPRPQLPHSKPLCPHQHYLRHYLFHKLCNRVCPFFCFIPSSSSHNLCCFSLSPCVTDSR